MSLSQIPVEVFLDNILPACSVPDVLSLGSANRFFALITSDDTFWKRKLDQDFNFPDADTARTTGWKFIYQRMRNPRVFVWGEKTAYRLGLSRYPNSTVPDVPFPAELKIPNVHVVSLVAGGMSFHALDSRGDVYVWGTLDGTSAALRNDGFSEASKAAATPLRLQLPAATRSISCGRLHSMTLDVNANIWTFFNWGRPFRLVTPLLECKSPDSTPAQIECGWEFSSVLTQSGMVLFFPIGSQQPVRVAFETKMEDLDHFHLAKAHVLDGKSIPCHTWGLQADPIVLPPLPPLPVLRSDQDPETKLVRIAAMEDSLVGLTNNGHVVKFDGLSTENVQGRSWLPLFSQVDEVKAQPVFSGPGAKLNFDADDMRISHISAGFRTFIAYSTGSFSVVLMGSIETTNETHPTIIPELQNKSIISVVLGDYHFGALTSSGALYTWGAYSKGALGLGDPTKLDPGTPGGFLTEQQRQRAAINRFGTPPDVQVPSEVKFDHNLKKPTRRFCFAIAAAGWHFGALAIDLEQVLPDDELEDFLEPKPAERLVFNRGRGRGRFMHLGGLGGVDDGIQ